jgi:tetraacyldisaccharide 4'-kinase
VAGAGIDARLRAWVPRWWEGAGGSAGAALSAALWPTERLYAGAIRLRNAAYSRGWRPVERAPIAVVSVGNLTVGGTGKTPVAAWIAARMLARGRRPAIVVRGYGADEVLVHRELNPGVPVLSSARRHHAVLEAVAAGRDVAILDDGFQHRALHRDLDIVLLAAEQWERPRRLLPRGPWREPPASLSRADLVVVTRKSAGAAEAARVAREVAARFAGLPVAVCALLPARLAALDPVAAPARDLAWLAGRDVLAVASLGDPASFARQLEAAGARVRLLAYPDHHDFDAADAARIAAAAGGRTILMTRKEAVKLTPLLRRDAAAYVVHQTVTPELGEAELDRALDRSLSRR